VSASRCVSLKVILRCRFDFKYVGDESEPFIIFTIDIQYFSQQHESGILYGFSNILLRGGNAGVKAAVEM
jgi:hypothetical protein